MRRVYRLRMWKIKEVSKLTADCPIGFGDCPDCNYYVGGECEYDEEEMEEE